MMVRLMVGVFGFGLLGGCHSLVADCHAHQEYQRARQLAPLKVPSGLDSPNTQAALAIPAADAVAAAAAGLKDACLDQPPRYKAAPTNKAAG